MATLDVAPGNWLVDWAAVDVVYKILAGLVIGAIVGWGLARRSGSLRSRKRRRTAFAVSSVHE